MGTVKWGNHDSWLITRFRSTIFSDKPHVRQLYTPLTAFDTAPAVSFVAPGRTPVGISEGPQRLSTITGWWYTYPLKNHGVRQLGWWHSQFPIYMENKIPWFQTSNQINKHVQSGVRRGRVMQILIQTHVNWCLTKKRTPKHWTKMDHSSPEHSMNYDLCWSFHTQIPKKMVAEIPSYPYYIPTISH